MIRFVDLTEVYWSWDGDDVKDGFDPPAPCCAFLDTVTDKFVPNIDGQHVFDARDDFEGLDYEARLLSLVPDGFFPDNVLSL